MHIITENGVGASTTYNPLWHGTAAHARNLLIEAEALAAAGGFTEPHHRRVGERFTLITLEVLDALVVRGLKYTNWQGSLMLWRRDIHHLVRLMMPGALEQHREDCPPALAARVDTYIAEMTADRRLADSVSGLRQRFASIAEGAAGVVLQERDDGVDLRAAIDAGDLVVFNLDAARDANAARHIGNLALQDYAAALSELGERAWHLHEGRQHRLSLGIVDEFSALGGALIQPLFERARSHGGAIVLATQVAAVLEQSGLKDSVIKNSNIKILHQQDSDAEQYAALLGTETDLVETTQTYDDYGVLGRQTVASGQGSLREVEKFKIHPNDFRALEPGEAIIIVKNPRQYHKAKIRKTTPKQQETIYSKVLRKPGVQQHRKHNPQNCG